MDVANLTQLGSVSEIPQSPDKAVIEVIDSPVKGFHFSSRFTCPEMTSLCPRTNQPDFATLVIDYQPKSYLIESKSLKLFIASFRNHRAFHEECTVMISSRLWDAAKPYWLRVAAFWYPRGGIPIDVIRECGEARTTIPVLDYHSYRAR
jgi:7-cyano-7-deazaguanine reductase